MEPNTAKVREICQPEVKCGNHESGMCINLDQVCDSCNRTKVKIIKISESSVLVNAGNKFMLH